MRNPKSKKTAAQEFEEFMATVDDHGDQSMSGEEFLAWLDEPVDKKLQKKWEAALKFGDKALIEAERHAGGVAWISICELRKLIHKLPLGTKNEFNFHLNIVLKSLYRELLIYKTLESKKAQPKNQNAGQRFSPDQRAEAVRDFNSRLAPHSRSQKAKLVVAKLAGPKPSWQAVLNWVNKAVSK